ncbi:hypothetical protein OR1_02483 [Geobacter sp. OR-1]|nr:hypothetical protein OR1_02483 [Geobacter sp. OR-1]
MASPSHLGRTNGVTSSNEEPSNNEGEQIAPP